MQAVAPGAPAEAVAPASVLRSPETRAALAYHFRPADEQLLDEVEHGAFLYFWKEVGRPAGLVKDRLRAPVSSVAAVGFQLSSLPIGVERGWITRADGERRARAVLHALVTRADNKRFGMYLHFPDQNTGGPSHVGYEALASTVDTALLIAGAIPAAVYFGGEVEALTRRLIEEADWRRFVLTPEGFVSMGWRPEDPAKLEGPGSLHQSPWHLANDEERLLYFLAVGTPVERHALSPKVYYRLERHIKRHDDMPPFVVSYPGALFTHIFSHCWIDYRALPADDPQLFGVDLPRVDWFENARRATLTQRRRCREQAPRLKSFAKDRWGVSACDGRDGYIVPNVQPNLSNKDEWFDGTIAPYAAASAIMFTPAESMAAIRAFRALRNAQGEPLIWRPPSRGGYGFMDSFCLDQGFVSQDIIGIDQGPMLLAIENARTGLIWNLFMKHPLAIRAAKRLGWVPRAGAAMGVSPTSATADR